jgi:hypothetical protein
MGLDVWGLITKYSGEVIAGLVGGAIVAVVSSVGRYLHGWHEAGRFRGADFHIAATMYTPIDLNNPAHVPYRAAAEAGKTHIQELLWLGEEVALSEFLTNPYVLNEVTNAMSRARDAGLLLGDLLERAERPLLKKILGYHNRIPATDLVRIFKETVGKAPDGRVYGIAPPTHEHYAGSPHRRVLRAMFVADSQLRDGLPPRDKVEFREGTQENRYTTLTTLIEAYQADRKRFAGCRAYF